MLQLTLRVFSWLRKVIVPLSTIARKRRASLPWTDSTTLVFTAYDWSVGCEEEPLQACQHPPNFRPKQSPHRHPLLLLLLPVGSLMESLVDHHLLLAVPLAKARRLGPSQLTPRDHRSLTRRWQRNTTSSRVWPHRTWKRAWGMEYGPHSPTTSRRWIARTSKQKMSTWSSLPTSLESTLAMLVWPPRYQVSRSIWPPARQRPRTAPQVPKQLALHNPYRLPRPRLPQKDVSLMILLEALSSGRPTTLRRTEHLHATLKAVRQTRTGVNNSKLSGSRRVDCHFTGPGDYAIRGTPTERWRSLETVQNWSRALDNAWCKCFIGRNSLPSQGWWLRVCLTTRDDHVTGVALRLRAALHCSVGPLRCGWKLVWPVWESPVLDTSVG